MNPLIEKLQSRISQMKGDQCPPGAKGDKGEKGEDGYTPLKGVDYLDGEKGDTGVQGKSGKDGKSIKGNKGDDGINGKDGSPDKPQDIASKLNTLKEVLEFKVLKNIPDFAPFDKRIKNLESYNTLNPRKIDQRWHGGGLSKVAHDTTLTGDGTDLSPLSAIAVSENYKNKVSSADTTPNYLENKILAGSGISVTKENAGGNEDLKIANTAPDQTVAIAAGTNITSVTGTYPNFTINAATQGVLSGTINEIAYFSSSSAMGSLAVATYPSLTELSYVKGVTSAIQTQISGKETSGVAAGLISTHAALTTGVHGLAITAGQTLTVTTGGTLGTSAYTATATPTTLGLVIGTNVQAYNANLTAINQALTTTSSPSFTAVGATTFTGALTGHASSDALVNQTMYIGTTAVAINRASAALVLTGITSIDGSSASTTGNAATVTNGVYTNAANSMSLINPLTTIAESWIGPSSTTGIYFNGGNVGIGTTGPGAILDIQATTGTIKLTSTTGTNVAYTHFINTGGNMYVGRNNSTAGGLATGALGYAGIVSVESAHALQFGTDSTIRMTILPTSGNVGIGTTGPNYKLEIGTDSAGKPGVGGLWTVVSDENLKDNIVLADLDRCYEIIKTTPLKRFTWKDEAFSAEQLRDRSNTGFIAQDVQKVFPKSVNKIPFKMVNGDILEDCLDVNNGQMLMSLFGATQKLMAKIENLQQEIELLKK